MSKNLITRIAVASVSIPVILWICYQGGWWLKGMILSFALLASGEYLYNEKITFKSILFWLFFSFTFYTLYERMDISNSIFNVNYIVLEMIGITFFILTAMICSIGKEPPEKLFSKHSRLFWGFVYIAFLYPYVFDIGTTHGGDWLLFLFAILWVGDTAAMFVGKAFGKHKLAPAVSPNKTFEGFIGGIIGAVVVGLIMYYWKFNSLDWYHILIIVIGCSIFGQLGDLVESMWKRSLDIKDSSALIPGHGGILDRFDSLLFAAPFMYFYINNIL